VSTPRDKGFTSIATGVYHLWRQFRKGKAEVKLVGIVMEDEKTERRYTAGVSQGGSGLDDRPGGQVTDFHLEEEE